MCDSLVVVTSAAFCPPPTNRCILFVLSSLSNRGDIEQEFNGRPGLYLYDNQATIE